MGIYTFKAESVLKGGLAVENTSGKFTITADEPPSMRGTDTGMNPVEMLLCALGSCQCITARFLARMEKIDLQDYRVALEGDLDPAGFMKGAEGVRPGFQQIRVKVYIRANASPEDIHRFVDLVQRRCPVGDMLAYSVPVVEMRFVEE